MVNQNNTRAWDTKKYSKDEAHYQGPASAQLAPIARAKYQDVITGSK